MIPIEEILKGASKDLRAAIVILGSVWVVTKIAQSITQHKLHKAQTELTKMQIKEYKQRGY